MAKQISLKNQIYQQIANQQVQQVMANQREQGIQQLQADFDAWQTRQNEIAQLQADFDAWKQQNAPQVQPQPRQTIPSIADVQPAAHEQTEMEKHIAEVTKQAKENRLRERAQKLQQLEQIEASQPHSKKERETLANIEDISKKLTNVVPETEALDTVTKTWRRGQRPEATDTSSQVAARVTNEKKPEIDTTNVPVNVDRWLSPDTKLTEAEKKKAKEYASAELQKIQYGPNKMPLLNTPEERQHYADMVNLINKTNGFTNFMSGAIEVPYNLADMVSDGARSVGNQLGGLGAAITDKLGITEGATQRHNEQVEAGNRFMDQNEANMRQNFRNAQTQNPGAYTTGKIAGQTGMYMLTNPVFDGIAAGAGVESELAKFFINQGAQNVQDLVLDTAPTVRQLMEDGSTPEEVKREALSNILWNVAGNAVMGGLGAWAGNRAARNASDEAFRENVRAGADNLSRIANEIPGIEDADNVVRNATRQAETAAQNIENISKQIPNLPDYVTGGPTGGYDVNSTLKSFNDMEKDLNNFGKIHDELGKEIDSINDPTLKEGFKNLNDTYSRMVSEALQDGGVSASEWDEITEAYSKAHKELSESAENYIKQNSFGSDIDNALNDIQSFIDGFSGEKELHKELTDSLDEVKNAIRNGGDIEGARAKLDNALNSAAEIVQQDNDSLLGDITSEAFTKVKSATDGSVIRLSKSALKDALGDDAIFSDLNNMVYTGKGSIKFREGSGAPIDSIYNELRGLSDYELPEAHTEADQVAAIAKYISDVKAKNITPDNSAINEVKRLGNSLDEVVGSYNPNKVMAESANFNKPVSNNIDPEDFESIKNGNYYIEEKMPYKGAVIEDGKSRVVTNSAINADIIDADQLKNDPVIQEIAKYQKHKNDVTFAEAMDRVSLDGNKWKKDYIDGTKNITDDLDVDTVMLLMQDINKRLGKTTNQKTIESLTAQKNTLLSKLREYGTKSGQGIQAFAKWNDTADGALLNAQKVMDDAVGRWETRNVKAKEGNGRIAKALADMGHKPIKADKAPLTHDQIKKGVIAELNKEYGSVEKYFNDNDIEYLTQLAEDKSIPTWQITSEIEHKLKTGDWYTLDESVEIPKPTNKKLMGALNSLVGEQVRAEKPAPSLTQIREEVKNTLDKEFAELDETARLFGDDDIDYLANLINNGASEKDIAAALNHKLATGKFGISAKTMQQVNDIFKRIENYDPNSKQFVEGQLEAYRLLANEVVGDATAMEKFEAWRYLAMLGNPKTMLRNLVGNALFNVVTDTSNSLAAVGEAAIDKGIKLSKKGLNKVFNKSFDTTKGIQRTKSLLNPFKDNELIKAASKDADASRYRQMIGSKYEKFDKDTLRQQKSVFNSKLLKLYEKATDAGISDYAAVKTKFTTSLAGYLKANGLDKSVFEAETKLARLKNLSETRLLSDAERNTIEKLTKDIEILEKGRDYALKQAEYATFHEDNAIANWLSKTSKEAPGPLRAMVEGIVPFKKTPANVLKSGLEYSPLGAINSIKKTGKLIYENTGKRAGNLADTYINSKGKEVAKTFANDVIESWSKTLTGTGLTALGFYLFNKGVLLDSNKDTKYQDQLEGLQNYSIKIGDKTYTVDWAAPAVMPLLLGAETAKVWTAEGKETEQWYEHLDEYLNAANMIAQPIIETSMLQGVRDTLKDMASSAKTGDYEGLLTNAAYQMGAGYLSQGIPTISGQIARTVDNTRRSAYADKEGVAGTLEKQGRKIMNKIPGLSRLNQPYVDTYGREQKNSPFNPVGNLAYQMLSPGYLADVNTTDADRMSRDVYGISKNKSMLPEWQSYFTDSDGKRVSPENYTKAAKAYGQAEYEIRDALANDDWFNALEGTQKEEIVKGINTVAEHIGKSAIDPEYDKDNKAFKAYKEGGITGLLNYYKRDTANSTAGVSAESNAAKDIQEQIEKGNTDAANYMSEQSGLLPTLGLDSTAAKGAYTKAYGVYGEGYSAEEFAKTYKAIDKDHNQSLKKDDEVIPYMNSQNMSYDEGMKFWKAFARTKGKNPWKVPVLENGKWK